MKRTSYFEPLWLQAPRKPKVPCKRTIIPCALYLGKVEYPDYYTPVCPTLVRNSAGHYGALVRTNHGNYLIRVKGDMYEGINYDFARSVDTKI